MVGVEHGEGKQPAATVNSTVGSFLFGGMRNLLLKK